MPIGFLKSFYSVLPVWYNQHQKQKSFSQDSANDVDRPKSAMVYETTITDIPYMLSYGSFVVATQ